MSRTDSPTHHGVGFERHAGTVNLICALLGLSAATSSLAGDNAPDVVADHYGEYCSVCHGDHGDGNSHAQLGLVPPPRDFTTPEFAARMNRESLINAIRNGRPGTAMVAWQETLSDETIAGLADYILDHFMHRPEGSGPVTTGEALYRESCSVCHGDDGTGAVWGQETLARVPRNFRAPESRQELSRERMINSVAYGRPGTPMPGFATQLDSAQIELVVDYIRQTFMQAKPEIPAAGAYHDQPLPGGLRGVVDRGRANYIANCVACHGINGDGAGPRAYFIFPRPRNFNESATRQVLNRPALFRGIRDGVAGREMPAWGKVLGDQDIADIAEYVYQEFIRGEVDAQSPSP